MRVYELAKKAKISSQEILDKAKELGIEAANNFSSIGEEDSTRILAAFKKTKKKAPAKKKAKKKTAAPLKLKQKKSPPPKTPPVEAAKPKKKPGKSAAPVKAPLAPKAAAVATAVAAPRPATEAVKRKRATATAPAATKTAEAEAAAPTKAPRKKAKPKKAAKPPEKKAPKKASKKAGEATVAKPAVPVEVVEPEKGVSPVLPEAVAARAAPPDESVPKGGRRRVRHRPVVEEPEFEPPEPLTHAAHGSSFISATPVTRPPRRTVRKKRTFRRSRRAVTPSASERKTEFTVETPISVKNLSSEIGVKANTIIFKLMQLGTMVTINATLDAEQVEVLGAELGLTIHTRAAATAERAVERLELAEDKAEDLEPRPPVVTFLGHVDHGKTSLLDRIRRSDVVAQEYGGITQHMGAYRVQVGGKTVVFLDTPGHEAFTAMRARGANVTDIAALVVAADDGVMPQTEEAIDHARAAGVPIVVAINKCDKPEADAMRVKQQLTNLGLQPEEWGGDTVCVEVSAVTGNGVDELVEMLALVAELRELKANPHRPAQGTVIEAEVSGSQGAIAKVLIQNGTLHVGDVVVAGSSYGRVKTLRDDRGRSLREAGPAWPVTVAGLSDVPAAGDRLVALPDIQEARAVAMERLRREREKSVLQRRHVSLENLFASIEAGNVRELLLILKADVRGTLEALNQVIDGIKSAEVKARVIHASVGAVSLSDVLLADASDAIIMGMNVGVDSAARSLAEEKGVSIRVYNVIYRVKEDIEQALSGMLAPEEKEVVVGHAEVRRVFRISRYGSVAGCYVTDGTVARSHRARLLRDGALVYEGRLASLRREKDDVREVREGFECGILLDSYSDVKVGDIIETYRIEKIARTLEGSGDGAPS